MNDDEWLRTRVMDDDFSSVYVYCFHTCYEWWFQWWLWLDSWFLVSPESQSWNWLGLMMSLDFIVDRMNFNMKLSLDSWLMMGLDMIVFCWHPRPKKVRPWFGPIWRSRLVEVVGWCWNPSWRFEEGEWGGSWMRENGGDSGGGSCVTLNGISISFGWKL